MIETIHTNAAPAAIGSYSQAKRAGNMLFVSGQIPLDPHSGDITGDTVSAQAVRVLENLKAVLEAGGSSMNQVLKTTCYLANMEDFAAFNEIYSDYFSDSKPARACVAVRELPKSVLCEVDAVAICN